MIKRYRCIHCDDLLCETSICPVCGRRTQLVANTIVWSQEDNCPVIAHHETDLILKRVGTDIRPVFPEERLLLEILLEAPFSLSDKSVWAIATNQYIVDGKRIHLKFSDYLQKFSIEEIQSLLTKYERDNEKYKKSFMNSKPIQNFIRRNEDYLNIITSEALEYIQTISQGKAIDEFFVSFSGGKDSTVTSDLVMRALGTQSILHLYGDTTLEYPESYAYLQRFRKNHPKTPILVAKNNEQDFLSLCKVIGPPSRTLRWCCTVFKTGAISQKIEAIFRNKKQIISFQGIRRNESTSRNKYNREIESPKIAKQIAVSPIIDWFDSDIWLYILANGLDINDAYHKGYTRVGCWCCPHNSEWSRFLSRIYMKEETTEFTQFLYDFAKQIGKSDWKDYVDSGNWAARQGGNNVAANVNTILDYTPCALEENTLNFSLRYPIDDHLYNLFVPFGILDFSMGRKRLDEVYVLNRKTKEPILRLSGKKGTTHFKVSIIGKHPKFKSKPIAEAFVKAQITKFQSCIGCNGCQGACKFNAITIQNMDKKNVSRDTIRYFINPQRCVGCMECVLHFDRGCLMYKVLKTRNDTKGKS